MSELEAAKNDELLSAREASALLLVSVNTFYLMVQSGKVPHIRIGMGRNMKFRRGDIEALMRPTTRGAA